MTVPEGGSLVDEVVVSLDVVSSAEVDEDVDVGVNMDTLETIDEEDVDSVALVAARRQDIKALPRRWTVQRTTRSQRAGSRLVVATEYVGI